MCVYVHRKFIDTKCTCKQTKYIYIHIHIYLQEVSSNYVHYTSVRHVHTHGHFAIYRDTEIMKAFLA